MSFNRWPEKHSSQQGKEQIQHCETISRTPSWIQKAKLKRLHTILKMAQL